PIGAEDEFNGINDLVEECAYMYGNDLGTDIERVEIPEEHKELAAEYRGKLIEAVAELDEEMMMKYLEGEEITVEE
nr:elongation factor G [Streptococcus sp. 11-4097]